MGTNYDWHFGEKKLHVGKSSAGWCFSLHVIPEEEIRDLVDWQLRFAVPESYILNEYGDRVSMEDMIQTITGRSWPARNGVDDAYYRRLGYGSYGGFLQANQAEEGPNGLLRHAIRDASRCIGHGAGTWDLITGEFS